MFRMRRRLLIYIYIYNTYCNVFYILYLKYTGRYGTAAGLGGQITAYTPDSIERLLLYIKKKNCLKRIETKKPLHHFPSPYGEVVVQPPPT